MNITVRLTVAPDGSVRMSDKLPAGSYVATLEPPWPDRRVAAQPLDLTDWPSHDFGPWPSGLRLSRDDICDDDLR